MLLLITSLITCNTSSDTDPISKIEYLASTRGSSIHIVVQQDQLLYNDNSISITTKQWESLIILAKEVKLEGLKDLEAPSQDRFRDAALAAALKIITTDTTFTSSQFDHGNPPKELGKIIERIFSLAGIE